MSRSYEEILAEGKARRVTPHPSQVTPSGPGHVTGLNTTARCEWPLPDNAPCGEPAEAPRPGQPARCGFHKRVAERGNR